MKFLKLTSTVFVKKSFIHEAALAAFFISGAANAFTVDVANAPSNNLALTVSAIQSAKQSLFINIYELTSSEIEQAIINRIQAGVNVQILEEGQPVGGFSAAARGVQAQINQAMKSSGNRADHLFEMTSAAGGKRRFHFDHGKYAVIDGNSLLIGSENYSPSSSFGGDECRSVWGLYYFRRSNQRLSSLA